MCPTSFSTDAEVAQVISAAAVLGAGPGMGQVASAALGVAGPRMGWIASVATGVGWVASTVSGCWACGGLDPKIASVSLPFF